MRLPATDMWRGAPVVLDEGQCPVCLCDSCENPSHVAPFEDVEGQGGPVSAEPAVTLDDFHAYMPTHSYIFVPSRELWPGSSVNARVPPVALVNEDGSPALDKNFRPNTVKASAWLDRHHAVEQMTWVPGKPMLIRDRLVSGGGWIERPGCTTFNLYRPPALQPGDPDQAGAWLDHIQAVYPDDAAHIVAWLAHRVQRPADKINHAVVLGGPQGVGKDTLLEPLKAAIGPWNFGDVSPTHLLGRFNGFIKSVILRVSEARDLGEVNRFAFYDHLKNYTAAPPDVLLVDEKHLRAYSVWNVTGVIITTNHRTDGMYLPADDRRRYVAWSERTKADFTEEYWTDLYRWYADGGTGAVAAFCLSACFRRPLYVAYVHAASGVPDQHPAVSAAVRRRGGVRAVPGGVPLAGRLSVSTLRPRPGLPAGRVAAAGMRSVSLPGVVDSGHRLPPDEDAADGVVLGRVSDDDRQARDLGAAAATPAGHPSV